jgi:tRNA A-37 threonylcarbamoyl transferase component Bud32
MARVIAVGMPENDSERAAIAYLAKYLPDDYLLFHNLELNNPSGLPYEYDIIVVGHHAVYVVEVKGYRGTVRGNALEWELNAGTIYKSPLPLANKKAKVVKDRLGRRVALRDVFVDFLIMLTDPAVIIDLPNDQKLRVLKLDQAVAYLTDPRSLPVLPISIAHLRHQIEDVIGSQFRPLHRTNEIGGYRVIDTVAKNNLYTTFLAEHRLLSTGDRFILKAYSFNIYADPAIQAKQKERILRDANTLHLLAGHPNIAEASQPFPWEDNKFVLPVRWINGFSLRGLLDAGTELSFESRLEIVRQAAEGLHYAHMHGVVHRDVRPDNIIVPVNGPIKLVNFDFARIESVNFQTIATQIGRAFDQRYVAPEVFHDVTKTSSSSDQYSLGIVLYELLAGRMPYQRLQEVVEAKGLPAPPSKYNPSLSQDADQIVLRMCALKPAQRYLSMAEVIEDLTIIG